MRMAAEGFGFLAGLLLALLSNVANYAVVAEDNNFQIQPSSDGTYDERTMLEAIDGFLSADPRQQQRFRDEIARFRTSPDEGFCGSSILTCDVSGHIDGLEILEFSGVISLEAIPAGITSVSFVRGVFRQQPDFSMLPPHVRSLSFDGSKFRPNTDGGLILQLSRTLRGLQRFTCKGCELTALDITSLPTLLHLDISDNHFTVPRAFRVPTLQYLNISGLKIEGERLWPALLPLSLLVLDASRCHLTGSLTTLQLPPHLQILSLAHNHLVGPVSVAHLPESLVRLDLTGNAFDGSLTGLRDFKDLGELHLASNRLTSIVWEELPPTLYVLNASRNRLEGPFIAGLALPSLIVLDLAHNQLSGGVEISALPQRLAILDIRSNAFGGPVECEALGPTLRFVFLQNNRFTGRCDLSRAPMDLRQILIGGNLWTKLTPKV